MTDSFYVMLSIGIPFVILLFAYFSLLKSHLVTNADLGLAQGQIKYWQQQYEHLKNKQQPRSKNGRYATDKNQVSTILHTNNDSVKEFHESPLPEQFGESIRNCTNPPSDIRYYEVKGK